MVLRDDHDAALARADALQTELDRERSAHAEQSERIQKLEAELREARTRLERAEETLGGIKPRKPLDVDRAPPQPEDPSAKIGLALVAIVAVIGIGIALAKCNNGESSESAATSERTRPKEPFVADVLMKEGLPRVDGELLVSELAFDYVRPDGTLDPTHGRVSITTKKRKPPKPPDDPNRPTGAPEPHDPMIGMMLGHCPVEYWSPMYGWDEQQGSCMSFGDEPPAPPRCTPASVVARARADGAPDGLARIHAEWTYIVGSTDLDHGWKWSFSIADSTRGVSFQRDYDDRECPPPPVEK